MKKLWTFLILIVLIVSMGNSVKAQYCTTNLYNSAAGYNCEDGDNINDFTFNTINHVGSGCSTGGYGDFTSMSTNLTPGQTYTLTVTTQYSSENLKVWIDFNDDYNFDPSELIDSSFASFGSGAPYVKSVTIPFTATPGTHRMRARLVYYSTTFQACDQNLNYGEVHDYTVIIGGSVPPMTYASSTTTQNSNDVGKNSVNQHIIGIQVVTNSGLPAINATQFDLNTNGTTAPSTDIANAKLWYTGSSSNFATTNQFGSTVASPNGNFSFTGSQTLLGGVNYFWLTYDITSNAVNDNYVDAECTSIVVDDTTRIPTITAPAGARQIKNEVIIGTGTQSSYTQPMNRFYNYSSWEAIYTQSEMGGAKDLTHIFFDKGAGTDLNPLTNVMIYMMHTTGDTVATGQVTDTSGYTLVYSGSFPNNNATGWHGVALNNIFSYNGVDNLRILIRKYHQAYITTAASPAYKYTATTVNRSKNGYSDTQIPTLQSMAANLNRPNVKFSYQLPQPMAYVSSAANHPSTLSVISNTTNNIILGVQVVLQGSLPPVLSATSLTFNTNGTTNPVADIANAKLWYSGTNPNASAAVQIGTTIANPNGSMVFNTGTGFPVNFTAGTHYFWLTYDITPTATTYNVVDAEATSIVIGGNTYVPSPSAPAGNRVIRSALSGTYTIDNTLPASPTNYTNFVDATNDLNVLGIAGSVTFNVTAGQEFPITLPASPNNYGIAIATTGTEAWPIKFQKNGSGANPKLIFTGTSATNDIGVFIYGADYVKFDGIDVYDGGTSTTNYLEFGYYLQGPANNGCQYDTIMNCVVNLNKANTSSRGIYTNINAPTSADGANSYNVFINNTIQNAYNGYYLLGNSTYHDKFNKIIGGTIDNIGNNLSTALYGIYSYYQDTAIINNLTLSNFSTSAAIMYGAYLYYNYGLEFSNNILTNFTNTTSSTYGIYPYYGSNYKVFNNTVSNLTSTTGGMYVIYPYYTTNWNIYNNTIRDITSTGIASYYLIYPYYNYSGTYNLYNNTIRDITTAGSIYGIYPNYANGTPFTMNIYNNKLYNLRTTTTSTAAVYGIYTALSSTNSNTLNIYNNLIYGLAAENSTSPTSVNGMYLSTGININVYNNTVYLDYTSTNASNGSAAVYSSTTPTSIDLINNIFINKVNVTTGTRAVAFQRSGTGFTNIAATTNNNLYFAGSIPSAKNLIFFDGTNRDSTLTQYKNRIASKDQTAKTEDVPFISNIAPYNFNVDVNVATQAESGGTPVAIVTTDIDGTPRYPNTGYPNNTSYPATAIDLGCYEFAGIPKDLTPPSIAYSDLTSATDLTGRVFSNVAITDQGSVNVTTYKPRAYYKKTTHANTFVDNTNATDGWKYVEATGTTSPFTFNLDYSKLYTAPVTGDTLQYFVIAQDNESTPNVGALSAAFANAPTNVNLNASNFPATNTKWYRLASPINGTILVGQGQPFNCLTCAGDTSLFKFINANVVTGNVEVVITSNLTETGAVALNQFAEEGAGNYSLTIKPQNDTPDTIRGSFSGGLIRLNGADRVIFDGRYNGEGNYLTFANNATSGSVFLISSLGTGLGATNNIIRNCNIYMGGNGTGTYGISIGGTSNATTGAHNHNNSILYNNIYRVYVGVWAQGIASTGVMNNLTVEGNVMGHDVYTLSLGHDGVLVANTDGSLIKGNKIYNIVNTYTTSRGISLSTNTVNTQVIANYIDNLKYTGTAGYGSHGLYIASAAPNSNINVINNVINRISGDGWSTYTGSSQAGILIDGTSTGGINIYYNTVNLMGEFTRASTATITAALAINSTGATNLNVRNNIFSNTQRNNNVSNTSSRNYAIHCYSPVSAFASLDYNLYNVHDTSIQARVGNINSTQYLTLQDWMNATQLDLNSLQGNPMFLDSTDLYLNPSSPAIGAAVPITGIDKDISNNNRSTFAPTIGAYEFIPANKTLNLTLFLEGLFNGVNMNPVQDDMGDHFGPNIADEITVELRNGIDPSVVESTFTGIMLQTDGTCSINVPSSLGDSYYIVIKHRNSIQTWSSNPLSFTGNTVNYDFTSDPTSAYGDNLKEVVTGVYAIYVGDPNQDDVVDLFDLVDMDNDFTNGTVGYNVYDYNGDGVVDLFDLITIDDNFTTGIVAMYP